jgi:DNA polymerase III sliding clamp (beta) subunit (PCNA family)
VDYNDEPFIIGFNSSFLIDILSAIDTQNVKFEFVEKNIGAVIRPVYAEDEEAKNILFLLMPLRINE